MTEFHQTWKDWHVCIHSSYHRNSLLILSRLLTNMFPQSLQTRPGLHRKILGIAAVISLHFTGLMSFLKSNQQCQSTYSIAYMTYTSNLCHYSLQMILHLVHKLWQQLINTLPYTVNNSIFISYQIKLIPLTLLTLT